MGRSLRRIKRYRPKLTKKKLRQPQRRAPTPIALQNQEPALNAKLDGQPAWDSLATYPTNYQHTGLVDDPNRAVGVRFADGVKPLVRASQSRHPPQHTVQLLLHSLTPKSKWRKWKSRMTVCQLCAYVVWTASPPPRCTDLRVLLNKERLAGKAPPPKLTAHQQQVVQRLVDAHGEDVEV